MIEESSNPTDLAFDELQRVLWKMEWAARPGGEPPPEDVSRLIDAVLDVTGKEQFSRQIGIAMGAEFQAVKEEHGRAERLAALMVSALERASAMQEAWSYIHKDLIDAPSEEYVLAASAMLRASIGVTQERLAKAMAKRPVGWQHALMAAA